MKKLIPFLIGLMIILSIVQAAPPIPAPVKILLSVNGQNADYSDTEVTNKYTGEVLTRAEVGSLDIQDGVGLFDLSEFKQGYEVAGRTYLGDIIEIVACDIHIDCTQTFRLVDTYPRTISFSINTEAFYVCSDGRIVTDASLCPVTTTTIPTIITTTTIIQKVTYVCADGTEVAEASECPIIPKEPKTLQEWLIGLIAGIIGVFAWGKGFAGLIRYYLRLAREAAARGDKELAKKYRARAEKMAKTVVFNFLAGKYKKK